MGAVPEPLVVDRLGPEHLPKGSLSIAVFGPGHGEAILIRFPDGSIGVVDGCRKVGDPVAALIRALDEANETEGGEPCRVRFVCMTHPHRDHVLGLPELLKELGERVELIIRSIEGGCREGKFWLQYLEATYVNDELFESDEERNLWSPNLLKDVYETFLTCEEQENTKPQALLRDTRVYKNREMGLEVLGAGPTTRDLNKSKDELVKALIQFSQGEKPPSVRDPNEVSGSLLLKWGESQILLAGDALSGHGQDSGWNAVLENDDIEGPVQVVNVAHHASDEAHHKALWANMSPSLSIVTCFQSAQPGNKRGQPPRPEMVAELAESSTTIVTSPPRWLNQAPEFPTPRDKERTLPLPAPKAKNASLNGRKISGLSKYDSLKNAVAVSMDSKGNITRLVLAGRADIYS